jgi:hypothetical protein
MSNADCVAVFDWDTPADLTSWLEWALRCFTTANIQPDIVSCGVTAQKSKKVSIEEAKKVVHGRVCDVGLYATRPGYKQLVFGWRMTADLNMTKGRTAILAWEAGLLDSIEIAKQMAGIFGPVYGIGFQRPFAKGPALYAYGMSAGLGYSGTDRIEMNRIGAWMRERMAQNRHKNGMLRDVYPLNLLTQVHLDQEVERHSLHDWIKETQERGQLVDLGNKQWIWRLPDASVENVRSSLRSGGLIIAE